jgi:hypothetical protein
MLFQEWKEFGFRCSSDGVVVALPYRWFDIVMLLADLQPFLHLLEGVVAQAKLQHR